MKRLLSVILALSMLMAFVPAVSAADAQPNFTINYDITGDLATVCGGTAMSAPVSDINLDYTNGFYAMGTAGYNAWQSSNDNFELYGTGDNVNLAMRNALHTGVKVWVPMAGKYTLKVKYATGLAFSQNEMRVFWHKETYDRSSGSRVGTYKSPEGSYSADEKWNHQFVTIYPTPFTATVTADSPGYYYVGFEVGGSNSSQTSGMYQRASFASISLESGDGNGNAIVLGSIDEPFALNTTDNKTKTLSVSGYLSKTRAPVEFKYISNNTNVATVDENGVVTAVGTGETTITATSKNDDDNVTVPLTTKVTVTDPSAYSITYDIGGTMTKYGMQKQSWGASKLHMSNVKFMHTNGFFEYAAANPTVNGTSDNAEYQTVTKTIAMNKTDGYVTFKINVPSDGDYKLWMDHDIAKEGAYVDVVIDGNNVGSYNCYSAGAANNWFGTNNASNHTQSIAKVVGEDGSLGAEAVFNLKAGEHTISFKNRAGYPIAASKRGSVGTFKLIKGGSDAVKPMHGYATVSRNGVPVTSLTNGETVTGEIAVYTTDALAAAAASSFTSSDTSVIEIDGTSVKAVGQGTATISASVEYDGTTYDITSYEILVIDTPITENRVSFYADATEDVELTVSGIDYVQGEVDGTVKVNTEVTLTAPTDIEGKTFVGWIRGSRDNGVWISDEAEINVRLLTHTFLTAVYNDENAENTTVRFWNWSGQYLGSETVAENTSFADVKKPDVHDFTGYEFAYWSVEDATVINKLTDAVAQFEKKAGNYSVTVPANVGGAASGDYEFDTEITLTSETPVYWERDGKTVDYGTSYSFFVWDDTVITVSDNGNKGPRVILDKHDDYGTYMIEYDNGDLSNMRILEAGILFGENATVAGFDSKAVSKKTSFSHGQFTAVPNDGADTAATGYVIYLDGGIVRVLYAK